MLLSNGEEYRVVLGDCVTTIAALPPQCFDLSVYSPPFPAIFSYTSNPEDIGNTEDLRSEVRLHFSFFFRQMIRVLKPGRVMVVHCMQIVRMKRSGGDGLFDFRGLLIRLAQRAGFVYDYDWVISKNPQAQAIRTKSRSLQFAGLESERAQSRGANPDYLLKFRVPGTNAVPIDSPGQVSRNEWIDWAECCWDDIRETDTLNVAEARGPDDVKHIAPLQLGVINRLVRLYSNPGEIIFSPFAGIGSEGFEALKHGRRFYGCEIKPEYHAACLKNLDRAIRLRDAERHPLLVGMESET
jgi:DNA modification methylase